jgi:phenylpyruvate tautomerase PptA (4-oxalocrotonate tautomerase family)
MPTYTSITRDGVLSTETRAWLAEQITRIHCEVMEVPPAFVRVVFLTYPEDAGFTAGRSAAYANLTCMMRLGSSVGSKAALLRRLAVIYEEATGAPAEQLIVALQEIPPSSTIEMGHIMPEPGSAAATQPSLAR